MVLECSPIGERKGRPYDGLKVEAGIVSICVPDVKNVGLAKSDGELVVAADSGYCR